MSERFSTKDKAVLLDGQFFARTETREAATFTAAALNRRLGDDSQLTAYADERQARAAHAPNLGHSIAANPSR